MQCDYFVASKLQALSNSRYQYQPRHQLDIHFSGNAVDNLQM